MDIDFESVEHYLYFGILIIIVVLFKLFVGKKKSKNDSGDNKNSSFSTEKDEQLKKDFSKFKYKYLTIYYIVMGADWLQGPYFYNLYHSYGYEKHEIAVFFLTGFMSSMIFGTFVGTIADKYGRKRFSILCGFIYGFACFIKIYNIKYILITSHIFSGVGTSLLHSVYEAWMMREHQKKNFTNEQMENISMNAVYGNGIVAIFSGFLATYLVNMFGPIGPFYGAGILLCLSNISILFLWEENYGNSKIDVSSTFSNAFDTLKKDVKIFYLGIIQAIFEGTMYIFVFLWSPSLSEAYSIDVEIPFGVIFSCFMVSIMIGSTLFNYFRSNNYSLYKISFILLSLSVLSFCVPIFFIHNPYILLICFFLFEICCGLYFSTFMSIRGRLVPENIRASISNFFRVPLNLFVLTVLLTISSLSSTTIFIICTSVSVLNVLLLHQLTKK